MADYENARQSDHSNVKLGWGWKYQNPGRLQVRRNYRRRLGFHVIISWGYAEIQSNFYIYMRMFTGMTRGHGTTYIGDSVISSQLIMLKYARIWNSFVSNVCNIYVCVHMCVCRGICIWLKTLCQDNFINLFIILEGDS